MKVTKLQTVYARHEARRLFTDPPHLLREHSSVWRAEPGLRVTDEDKAQVAAEERAARRRRLPRFAHRSGRVS